MSKTKKSKRIKYKTPINFPATFTLQELRAANEHKMKYITLYARVQKGIEDGTISEAGLRDPQTTRRGRKEMVYQVLNSQPIPVSTLDVAVPSATNW